MIKLSASPLLINRLAWSTFAFLLSFLLLGWTYLQFGFFPFGTRSILVMDMLQQNVAFFQSLRDLFSGDHSLFFSLSKSIGGNYIGLFAFYISSPLSWIVLLFSRQDIHLGIMILMWIKTALTSATMFYFLKVIFPKMTLRILLVAVAYSMMSYNLVYSLSLMWLDGVLLLPLIMLGVEHVINKQSWTFFSVSYGLLILANYYTAYMVGIFAFIYLITRHQSLRKTNDEFKQSLMTFSIGTLISFLLTAWFWLPVAIDLFSGKLETGTWMNSNLVHFNAWDWLIKLLPNEYDSIILGLPSIYVGWMIQLLALVFFFIPSVSKQEKSAWGFVILLFFFSFWIVRIDDVWHGFVSPNWFPFRNAFLFSFVMIYLAAKTLSLFNGAIKPRFLSYLLVFLYGPILMDLSSNGVTMFNGLNNQFGYMEADVFDARYQETQAALELIPDNHDLYRIEKDYEISKNDPMLFGYYGVSHYSSNYQAQVNQTMQRLGFAQAWYWNSYFGSTPVMDSVLGIRYVLTKQLYASPYVLLDTAQNVRVYENPYALPLIFSAHENIHALQLQSYDPFVEQTALLQAIHGSSNNPWIALNTEQTILSPTLKTFTIQPAQIGPVYFYVDSNTHGNGSITVNQQFWGSYFGQMTSKISTFSASSLGDMVVRVQNTSPEKMSVYDGFFYQFDTNQLQLMAEDITNRSQSDFRYKEGKFEGTITVGDNETIATSIPFLTGYQVYVNEKKVSYRSYYNDTFLSIPVPEPGTYQLRIEYISDGFEIGFSISLLTLSALVSVAFYEWKFKQRVKLNLLRTKPKSF